MRLIILLLTLIHPPIFAENSQVANFAINKYGTATYEHFTFWVENGKQGEITYRYGKSENEIKLTYLGLDTFKGEKCFKVQFPNGLVLFVIPKGSILKIADSDGKYTKNFRWEYEGPINGIGTACSSCVDGDKEAVSFVRKYFLR